MWIAVNSVEEVGTASIITVDLAKRQVASISTGFPQLAGHFANCKSETLGGIRLAEKDGIPTETVELGEVSATGKFNVIDSVKLPAGSKFEPTGSESLIATPPLLSFESTGVESSITSSIVIAPLVRVLD